jgi:hypothetical protein
MPCCRVTESNAAQKVVLQAARPRPRPLVEIRTAISDADVVGDGLILSQSGFEVFFDFSPRSIIAPRTAMKPSYSGTKLSGGVAAT